ncbi:MAG: hypothetical protein R3225_07660 [Halofilum sp. (in: g-proteobacteria)]|nr:hypothetical protein [Halofilum sp. (in: g-proteobacteria)]
MSSSEPALDEAAGADVHRRFLAIAADVSAPLAEALAAVGPRRFPDRSDQSLARFLARAVVGQQLSTHAARSIWSRVEGAAAEAGVDVLELGCAERQPLLQACGLSRNKARALGAIRAAQLEGRLDGTRLREFDHAAIKAELGALWGVGPWTCDMAALFYCRCPDVWPEGDVTVRKTFSRLIGARRKPSKWAARFAPERSWLALYMWAVVDAVPD